MFRVVMGLPDESLALIVSALPSTGAAEDVFRTLFVSCSCTVPADVSLPKAEGGMVIFTPADESSSVPPDEGVIGFDDGTFNVTRDDSEIFFPVTDDEVMTMGFALYAVSA